MKTTGEEDSAHHRAGVRGQGSEVRGQGSGVRGQGNVRYRRCEGLAPTSFACPEIAISELLPVHSAVFHMYVNYCSYTRYWVGVAQLAVARGDRGKALLVILSLRDTSLLQGNQKWGMLTTHDTSSVSDCSSHHQMDCGMMYICT